MQQLAWCLFSASLIPQVIALYCLFKVYPALKRDDKDASIYCLAQSVGFFIVTLFLYQAAFLCKSLGG